MIGFFSATRHGIPLLALAMLGFGGWSVASKYRPRVVTSPPIAAPTSPYGDDVAGSGIIEPASELIALATERGGVVTRIAVVAGDLVKAGQPLFSIDDRNYRATVAKDEATVASATASVAAIDQSLILQDAAIEQALARISKAPKLNATERRWTSHATPTSCRIPGRLASALRPPKQMPKRRTQVSRRPRRRWPARNNSITFSWRSARTRRRSSIRRAQLFKAPRPNAPERCLT